MNLKKYIEQKPNSIILDIGCGNGSFLNELYRSLSENSKPTKLVAIDENDLVGGEWFYNEIDQNKLELVFGEKGDILNFRIDEEKFDFILARDILHFLTPSNIRISIDKIFKGTKKGGKIFVGLNIYEKSKYFSTSDEYKNKTITYSVCDENFVRFDIQNNTRNTFSTGPKTRFMLKENRVECVFHPNLFKLLEQTQTKLGIELLFEKL